MAVNESILLQVDVAFNNSRLAEITKELAANKEQVRQLTAEYKTGSISADFLAAAQVRLKQQAKNLSVEAAALTKANEAQVRATQAEVGSLEQMQEQLKATQSAYAALSNEEKASADKGGVLLTQQRNLTEAIAATKRENREAAKASETARKETEAAAGSIDQLRAQLAAATRAYNALSETERDNTEAGQKLQAQTKAISDQLKVLEGAVGDNRRNVGNYAGSIGPLIQELVKLQEQQKQVGEGSAEYNKIRQQIGFVTKATQEAGAKAGLTYDQTQAKLREYGEAVRPVIAEVVKLEKEQENLEESGEAYTKIGFQIAGLKKKVEEVPVETKKVGDAFQDAAGQSQVLSGAISTISDAKAKYTTILNLAKVATAGEVTVLGALKLALIATGIGAFVVVLGSLFAFLTKTQQGTDFLSKKMAFLGGVITTLTNSATDFGQKIFKAFEDPKQAAKDFGDFLVTNIINRFKAFGVLIDAIRSGSLSKLGDAFIQVSTGITDGTQKLSEYGAKANTAAQASERLALAERQLNRDIADNTKTNKELLNQVERLKNVRDDERNSIEKRTQANSKALSVELERESRLSELAQRRLNLIAEQIKLAGGRDKVSIEEYQRLKDAENELVDVREDAAGRQNELITNGNQLAKELQDRNLANTKGYYNAIALEAAEGSKQELEARIRTIEETAKAEANRINITAGERKEVEQKALDDIFKLREEYDLKAQEKAKQELEKDLVVAGQRLEKEQQSYDYRLRDLNEFIDKQQQALDRQLAENLISQETYDKAAIALEDARLKGIQVANEKYKKDSSQVERDIANNQIREPQRGTTQRQRQVEKNRELEDERIATGRAAADTIISLFGEESQAGEVAIAAKKAIALVEVGINLERALSNIVVASTGQAATNPTPVGIGTAFAYNATATILALAQAAASTAAIIAFKQGGAIDGPGTGTSDSVEVRGPQPNTRYFLSAGEHVLTAAEVQNMGGHGAVELWRSQFRQPGVPSVLSWMHNTTTNNNSQTHFASGGAIALGTTRVFDGGFAQRSVVDTAPTIDYNQLAQAMEKVSIITRVKDINEAQTKREKPRALARITTRTR